MRVDLPSGADDAGGWTLTVGDRKYRESDLTMAQAMQVQELTGSPWPRPMASAADLSAVLGVFLAGGDPEHLDAALVGVAGLSMVEALATLSAGEE